MKLLAALLLPVLVFAAPAAPGKTAPVNHAAVAKASNDPGWPREITRNGIKLTIYQPQIDEWKDYRTLKARAAIVLTAKDGKPNVGVVELGGMTTTNVEERSVLIRDLKITSARFPSLPEAEEAPTEALLKKTFPGRSLTVALDRLAAGVERGKEAKPLDLKMDPPAVVASTSPSMLLIVEGKPVLAPIEGTKLQFVVNTNWDLFFDADAAAYFLLAEGVWLSAPALDGQWSLTSTLPKSFAKLPKGEQWDHVKKALPAKVTRGMTVPHVFYSEKPAELIEFEGNPVWEEVEDTSLLWGKNTESWVFEDTKDRQIYFLVSGRWFRAAKWEGPWTFAGNDLPADFKQISPDSPCADVLSSVPGTPEAADAILLAEVPNEAVIDRKQAEAKAKVAYDGDPKFAPVEGTTMTYATNTSSDVIQVENKYYLCQDAVWFVGPAAIGPWAICVDVPGVIYTIPPAYPVHRVTYVKVETGETPDVVVCNYTAGYFGAFVAGAGVTAALVWGTGYYYPPYVAWGGPVPIYRPWPATYGVAAAYNPWTGGYAVGARAYGPYATAGRAAWYNPATGNYGRAARVSGPYGARTVAAGYNPRTDTAWATRQGNNGYAQWGTSAVRQGDDWVRAGHIATEDGGVARWRGSEGGGRVWKGDDHSGGAAYHDGNFYAGRDGNVYRRDDDGNWAKYDGGGDWDSIDKKDDLKDSRNRYQQHPADNRPNTPSQPNRPQGGGDNFKPGGNTRPGEGGGGEQTFKPGENTRPGQGGGGEQKFKPGENPRPGQGGGGEQKFKPGENTRPGQGGGGEQKFKPGEIKRPGEGGRGEQRFDRDSFENRAPKARAANQPGDDVMKNLNQESFNRQRSDLRAEQNRSFQPQQRQAARPEPSEAARPQQTRSFPQASAPAARSSRSFEGGGGGGGGFGGGGHARSGGFRRR